MAAASKPIMFFETWSLEEARLQKYCWGKSLCCWTSFQKLGRQRRKQWSHSQIVNGQFLFGVMVNGHGRFFYSYSFNVRRMCTYWSGMKCVTKNTWFEDWSWAMKLVPFNSFNQKDVELEKSKGWAGKWKDPVSGGLVMTVKGLPILVYCCSLPPKSL